MERIGGIYTAKTRDEAQEFADKLNAKLGNVLDNGQASKDVFSARKVRGKNYYGVWIKVSYCSGTLYAPKSRFLKWGEE